MELAGERRPFAFARSRALRSRALDLEDDRGQGLAGLIVKGAGNPQTLSLLGNEGGAGACSSLIGKAVEHCVEGVRERGQL